MSKLLHSEQQLLSDWAVYLDQMFKGETSYHVGSSVLAGDGKPHRDVDMRVMLQPEDFKKLQSVVDVDRLNLAVSIWGQKVTGMPIDFQVQDNDYANEHHKGVRSAVGIRSIAKGDGYER